jgi:peptidoglycan/xylan/chitin deacetylase (PgdA/CDA1 family)
MADYAANILGVRQAIPAMLNLFREYEIHATWATVGLLFFSNKEDMVRGCPQVRPAYENSRLSPYTNVQSVGADESQDPYHFGHSLIQMVRGCSGQEIGSHTFSHYYCLEPGQTEAAFRADLEAAKRAANALALEGESLVTRAHRLLDSYANISGHNTYALERTGEIVNVPASRFLRPHNRGLAVLDGLKFRRIASGIRDAAQSAKIFHLWWHPHNFGIYLNENIAFLRRILDFVSEMKIQHGMKSLNMGETSQLLAHAR